MAAPTVPAQRIATLSTDSGEAWWWFGGLALIKVASKQTEGKYSLIEMLWPPSLEVPLHVHTREDELFYVLEGKIAYRVGDVRAEVSAGHTVFAPRNIPHGFIVTSPEPARYLIVYSPSLRRIHPRYEHACTRPCTAATGHTADARSNRSPEHSDA